MRDLRLVGLAIQVLQRLRQQPQLLQIQRLVNKCPGFVAIAVGRMLLAQAALSPHGRQNLVDYRRLQRCLKLGQCSDIKQLQDALHHLGQCPRIRMYPVAGHGQRAARQLIRQPLVVHLVEAVFDCDLEQPVNLADAAAREAAHHVIVVLGDQRR